MPARALNLVPAEASAGVCVELFGGLGGLALGLARANWRHELLVERDPQAVATLEANKLTSDWPLRDCDLREVDFAADVEEDIDLLAAGVPCQPFSQAGAHAGPADERNMFPETFAAIRDLKPKAVLIENVRVWRVLRSSHSSNTSSTTSGFLV